MARSGINCVSNQGELRLVISKDPENTLSLVNADLENQLSPLVVGEPFNELHHVLGQVDASLSRVQLLHLIRKLILDEFEPSTAHVCLSNCLYLLNTMLLTEEVKRSEQLIKDFNDRILAFFDHLVEVHNVTEQDGHFSSIVCDEIT